MKFPIFTLFVLSLFFMASCQNNSSKPAPAPDAATLDQQIALEVDAGIQVIQKFDSTYRDVKIFISEMKSAFGGMDEAGRAKIQKINEEVSKFGDPFVNHNTYTNQLATVSEKLNANTITLAEAQKEYDRLRVILKENAEKLASAKVDLKTWRSDFETLFAEANRKAAGGQ